MKNDAYFFLKFPFRHRSLDLDLNLDLIFCLFFYYLVIVNYKVNHFYYVHFELSKNMLLKQNLKLRYNLNHVYNAYFVDVDLVLLAFLPQKNLPNQIVKHLNDILSCRFVI